MSEIDGRDLDLNLLRVLVVVADSGSVTSAASRLYLTQPAVSAALKRLHDAVGARLFVRRGRGIALTARGRSLVDGARPHLLALIDAALAMPKFDAAESERVVRLGLSSDLWLLPRLVRVLAKAAPKMTLIVLPVQFRDVGERIASGEVDVAVCVADALPRNVKRRTLFRGGYRVLFDPRHAKLGPRPSLQQYLAHHHVVVSYNGDLRGVVEDHLGIARNVRVSVNSFHGLGAIVEGSALVATVPARVAEEIVRIHPRLQSAPPPFHLGGTSNGIELLWPAALDDDPACGFVRERILELARVK